MAIRVAQIFNLLYRRIAFGKALDNSNAGGRSSVRANGARLCRRPAALSAISIWQSSYVWVVAQIFNLLYRRIAFGKALDISNAVGRCAALRSKICATWVFPTI